ncbi:MAG: hypothetical protein JRF70_05920 [Deltaproteobacteria bacterium]|nr:hypothetical protein [Deltaproteobacteria bacterium]
MRLIPEAERAFKVDRLVPIAKEMASTPETLRDLAAILAAYLREHRPETTVAEGTAPAAKEPASRPARRDDDDRPPPRRRGGGGGRRRRR